MSIGAQRGLAEPRMNWGKTILLTALVLALVVLHQDWWFWHDYDPRLFGFVPIGLAYHAAYSVACAVLMWILVRFAWPKHLESLEKHGPSQNEGGHE